MRKKVLAANWKMNLTYAEAMSLTDLLVDASGDFSDVSIILGAPFVYLHDLVGRIQSHPHFAIAAQNCSDRDKGAFTGEISASMISSIGVDHVIIGHSERRKLFGENDELLSVKLRKVLENSLMPIFCCGEDLSQRKSSSHLHSVEEQLTKGFFQTDTSLISQCMIAYEPVWAIGTGVNATPEEAQEMHAFIRRKVAERYSREVAQNLSIIYGGSVTSQNAPALFSCPDVDGALVGGASLHAAEFVSIISSMHETINSRQ